MKRLIFAVTIFGAAVSSALAGPQENMADAVRGIEAIRAIEVERTFGDDLCRDEQYCQVYAGNIPVSAMGGIVDALVSSMDPAEEYVKTCIGALSGLAHLDMDSATVYVAQAFEFAASSGSAEMDIAGVEMTIKPGLDSRLECQFWRR